MIEIKETSHGLVFSVYVQPRSAHISIVGCYQNALKIKLTAPPVNNAANKQCIQVLAKTLGLPKSALTITAGQTSRQKQINIHPTPDRGSKSLKTIKAKLIQLSSE